MNNYDQEFLEEAAQTVIKAESFMNDEELMKALRPIIDEMVAAAKRLQGFDFKSMRELAGKKALEEQNQYGMDDDGVVLGEDKQTHKIPGKPS